MSYWSALEIMKQISGELGLPAPTAINNGEVSTSQLLAALNSAGNELNTYYPWSQFATEWAFNTVSGQGSYDVPADWKYFTDQTQWDRTNHWPLLGPKSPQEWAWLKGGIVASFPRMRYRVVGRQLMLWPVPDAANSPYTMAMEYISERWVKKANGDMAAMVTADGDVCLYDPWLLIKFTKLKFYQLKGYDNAAVLADFTRAFESLTGKDTGAAVKSLTPLCTPVFIGPQSVPDGSWNTGA